MKGMVIPMKKCISMLSLATLTVFASFLIAATNVSNTAFAATGFTDFPAGAEVDFLIDQGIINGYEDGTFRPFNEITRAEFTAMLCRAMKKEDSAKSLAGQSGFSDVKPSNWASGYIQWAKNNGIINGVGGGRFDPQGNVTYEQAVKMIVLAMGYEESLAESKGGYPKGYMSIGQSAGLYIDVPGVKWESPAGAAAEKNTRQVVSYTMYNAFCDTSLSAKCRKLLTDITNDGMTELEKEKAIHDYLVLNTAYDYDNYRQGTIPDKSYTHKGVIFDGVGVCAGYASATKLLMNMAGIECVTVIGTAGNGGGHAWNIIKINGAYYNLDTTWDDPVPNKAGYVRYNYFNISDETLSKDHNWEKGKYPSCAADMVPALYGGKEFDVYLDDEIIPTLDEKLLEKMLTRVDGDEETPEPSSTPVLINDPEYKDIYDRGYSIGYSRGEAAGKKNASRDGYDEVAIAMGTEGLNDRAEEDFNEGFERGWAAGYEVGSKARAAEKSAADASLLKPIEQIFILPNLPLVVEEGAAIQFNFQVNEIVVRQGVDGNNEPNPDKTTIKLSCEILKIANRKNGPPTFNIVLYRHGDGGIPSDTVEFSRFFSEVPIYTHSAGGLGIFDGGEAKKKVGDTFEVTAVFNSGFPNVASTSDVYMNDVCVSFNHGLGAIYDSYLSNGN
jgi:hypothetical protein